MKKQLLLLVMILLPMLASAHDIEVQNADGVTIYYKYTNDGKELEVTFRGINYFSYDDEYRGNVVIPEEVTYMNRTRKVTSIGASAFEYCSRLTSITIPNSVTSIGEYAFQNCISLTSITIPNSVTSIGQSAFMNCSGLTSVTIPNSVTSIDFQTFHGCSGLTSITIPNSVTSIGNNVFAGCSGLTSVSIPNSVTSIGWSAFDKCSGLTSVSIPNNVTSIEDHAFCGCRSLTSITIPNNVTSIGEFAFQGCSGLTSVTIPNRVTSIGDYAFSFCSGLTSVTIGKSVTSIGDNAFYGSYIPVVISLIENPREIWSYTFSYNTFNNATLYVPAGTKDKYKATKGWKRFIFIEESGTSPTPEKCEKPTISYSNGKLTYYCETEGAICHSTIIDTDIKSYSGNEVQLSVTYNISVYATKAGYENSDVATATLCWIDATPQTEGIANNVANIQARAVLIQSSNNTFTIEGAEAGTAISVYDTSGKLVGSANANGEGATTINTSLRNGDIGIVKIGDKSVKVAIK